MVEPVNASNPPFRSLSSGFDNSVMPFLLHTTDQRSAFERGATLPETSYPTFGALIAPRPYVRQTSRP